MVARTTPHQIAFGRRLGLELAGRSVSVARALVDDAIDREFHGKTDLGSPTQKQVEFAAQFQRNIAGETRRVADAIVDELMTELNQATVLREHLEPGVTVRNVHDLLGLTYIVSSIHADGTVYFKGGNGKKAWARSLVRVTD